MFEPLVSVTWLRFEPGDRWHAVFMEDEAGTHQMFEGSREEAVAWGFERCPAVKVYVPGESRWEQVVPAG